MSGGAGARLGGALLRRLAWRRDADGRFLETLALAEARPRGVASVDETPWEHPFLGPSSVADFRAYSEAVWAFAREHNERRASLPRCAFVVNMAQNMYKWAALCAERGAQAELFPHGWDRSAVNAPEWEEFDGTWPDPLDGDGFLAAHGAALRLRVPVQRVPLHGEAFRDAYASFARGDRRALLRLAGRHPGLQLGYLFAAPVLAPYLEWAVALQRFDVAYAASIPLAALLSGRPYLTATVGGDLIYDCGRGDAYGELMSLAFASARFCVVSNPHPLAHARRLGLSNLLHLPYPMDDHVYAPGPSALRARWEAERGEGVYVLSTARLDARWKGRDGSFLRGLLEAARQRPELRFAYVSWGEDRGAFEDRVARSGLADRFLRLEPAGKRRLLEYYRASDLVLDQLAFGYYGATALEAAAVGKPVLMRHRVDHYAPLYAGDPFPAVDVRSAEDLCEQLVELAERPERRAELGETTRAWLVRHHGRERTVPVLLALLALAADGTPLPSDLRSPLETPLSDAEREYHAAHARANGARS